MVKCSQEIEVVSNLSAVSTAVPWILENQMEVDIFFMDIQLHDGLSFEIFSKVNVLKPVIFITAFDEYAIDAFKVNSIDYLLKPITFIALTKALAKFKTLKDHFQAPKSLAPVFNKLKQKGYKNRFLVKKGNHIQSILTKEVAYFYAEGRDVFLVHNSGKRYLIEYRLESINDYLNGLIFYRINRSIVVNIEAIKDVIIHSNRRLKLTLSPDLQREVIVSRERVAEFKRWLEGEK